MSKIFTFDTPALADRLEHGGFTAQQARTMAEAFSDALGEQIATKRDVGETQQLVRVDIAKLDNKVDEEIARVEN